MSNFTVKRLDGITSSELLTNNIFIIGHYVLNNDTVIQLVEKYENVTEGYIFNQTTIEVKNLFTWRLIPFDCKLDYPITSESNKLLSLNCKTVMDLDSAPLSSNTEECRIEIEKLVNFNNFNLDSMYGNPNICVIGKRCTGKTFRVREIIESLNKKKGEMDLLIFSKTEKFSKFYEPIYPNATISYEYNETKLKEYLGKATVLIENNIIPNICIVFDDCSESTDWQNDTTLMELLYNSKHYGITSIFTMQFPMSIKPDLRANFDYIFLLSEDSISNQKKLYDYYTGIFPSFDLFISYFIEATKDYGSMVISNRGESIIENKVFIYRRNY